MKICMKARDAVYCKGWLLVWVVTVVVWLPAMAGADNTLQGKTRQQDLGNTYAYMDLPPLDYKQRLQLAIEARRNPDKYLFEADIKIKAFSVKLERYIRSWLAGKASAEIPKNLLPPYIDSKKTHSWRLVKPADIDPSHQWYAMPAYDPSKTLHQFSPDPHATYLKLIFIAPLGAKMLVEGEFPHARFMDYQILTPVDPLHPVTGQVGICEVPIVDVDIEPDAGHVNPFRMGADRTTKQRKYHITFELQAGNALELNPRAMQAPQYRGEGNTRVGGPFAFTGPYGNNALVPSVVWLRYFAPDKATGPYGGVPWPKATLQLSTGEKFWITCDKSLAVKLQTDPVPRVSTAPLEPYPFLGPQLGWFKMFGILYLHAEARAYYQSKPWGKKDLDESKQKVRQIFKILFNQGADTPPPGNFGNAATECNYTAYLSRPMSLGREKVIVLTGKMPKFPQTRNGQRTMEGGEVRYYSLTHQFGTGHPNNKYHGTPYGILMDDEIVLNENREYVIVYSRKTERPDNAQKKYNVTWQEWGSVAQQTLVLRWMSVMPEWYLDDYSFHENNFSWEVAGFAQLRYDKHLFGLNRPGAMGPYHPVIHYMSTKEFEAILSKPIKPKDVPVWKVAEPANRVAGDVNKQDLIELKKALDELKKARQESDAGKVRVAAKKVSKIWNDLPLSAKKMVEKKYPGITEKIKRIHK